MMNLLTVVVKEDGYGVEAQSFNADTQRGREKGLEYFRECLNGYDVSYEEDKIEYLFNNGGVRDSVEVIESTL